MHARPRILLAQRADTDAYPPVLHQSDILSQLGDVVILDSATREESISVAAPECRRIRIPSAGRTRLGLFGRVKPALEFRSALLRELGAGADIAIAFEPDAAAVLLGYEAKPGRLRRIVHLHENIDISGYAESRLSSWAVGRTLKLIDRADFIVVADPDRAAYLRELQPAAPQIVTVMNCPRLTAEIPQSRLIPLLESRGHAARKVVHYQGSVGPDHGLETVIASMTFWPEDSVFVVVGHGEPHYRARLEALAEVNGAGSRVLFTGKVPYSEVLSYAAGATVGVTLLDPARSNWRFAAGASNKRFEYAALGIPQVTNMGPGMSELFGEPGIALLADPRSPAEIGAAIASYLTNPAAARVAGEKARALHLATYNYECQYQPVLDLLGLS